MKGWIFLYGGRRYHWECAICHCVELTKTLTTPEQCWDCGQK